MTADAEFVEFVQTRSSALLRTACLLTAGDRQAAEDLVQTALAQAFVAWRRIREPAAREAYVRRTLTRAAIRRTRRLAWRAEVLVVEPPVGSIGDLSEPVDQRLTVWPMLRALPARQRAVLVLRYYEDLSEAQIADALRCSPGTVKSHASRALETLRSQLGRDFIATDAPTARPEEP